MRKASKRMLEQGIQTPSPAPDLIPAETKNQPSEFASQIALKGDQTGSQTDEKLTLKVGQEKRTVQNQPRTSIGIGTANGGTSSATSNTIRSSPCCHWARRSLASLSRLGWSDPASSPWGPFGLWYEENRTSAHLGPRITDPLVPMHTSFTLFPLQLSLHLQALDSTPLYQHLQVFRPLSH